VRDIRPLIASMDQVAQFDGKVATLENGRVIPVPSFIKEGDTIMVALVHLAQPNPCRTACSCCARSCIMVLTGNQPGTRGVYIALTLFMNRMRGGLSTARDVAHCATCNM